MSTLKVILLATWALLPGLSESRAQQSGNARRHVIQADSCMAVNNFYDALRHLQRARQLWIAEQECLPTQARKPLPVAWNEKLADCFYNRGEYRNCVEVLQPTADTTPDSLGYASLRRLFFAYKQLQKPKEQLSLGALVLKKQSLDAAVLTDMADLYLAAMPQQAEKAAELTAHYLAVDSTHLGVLRRFADAHYYQKHYTDALKAYLRLAELGDSSAVTYQCIGLCYLRTDSLEASFKAFQKSVKLNNYQNISSLLHLGETGNSIGRLSEACSYLNMALGQLKPDNNMQFMVQRELGKNYFLQKQYFMAAETWKSSLKIMPTLTTFFFLGKCYGYMGDKEREFNYYKAFLQRAVRIKRIPAEVKDMMHTAENIVGQQPITNAMPYTPEEVKDIPTIFER